MSEFILDLQQVSLQVPNVSEPILADIHYSIAPHDFVLILGSNGSGKSSLLKLLSRQYQSTHGAIYLTGKNINQFSPNDYSRRVRMLTQNCNESLFVSLTVYENFLLFSNKKSDKKDRSFFMKYISDFNPSLANRLDQPVQFLSGGEKQALALALTLLHPPEILLLDEHTSALDPKTAAQIMTLTCQMATRYKITCLLTTHNMEMAQQYGNRILALKQGKIYRMIESHTEANMNSADIISACF